MARRRNARRREAVKGRAQPALQGAGRLTIGVIMLLIAGLVGVQFARAIGENVAADRELTAIRSDISTLQRRRDDQKRELLRLRDPQGAIPDIHERLRLVRPDETIIFVSPAPASAQ